MKCSSGVLTLMECSRSPCGERGLKFSVLPALAESRQSLPVRGAWVEITIICARHRARKRSLPVRGAWVEMPPCPKMRNASPGRSPCGERGLK